jgi:hypothetical protein
MIGAYSALYEAVGSDGTAVDGGGGDVVSGG